MLKHVSRLCCVAAAIIIAAPLSALAQGPSPAVREAISAVVEMLENRDDGALDAFIQRRLTSEYRESLSDGAFEHLRRLRDAADGSTGDLGVDRTPDGLMLVFSGAREVRILAELDEESGRFRRLELFDAGDADPRVDRGAASRSHERAIEGLAAGPSVYEAFVTDHLSPRFREELGQDALTALLDRIRVAAAQAGMVGLRGSPDGVVIELRGGSNVDVAFQTEEEPPYLISSLTVTEAASENDALPDIEPITWDNLEERLAEEAAAGFAGTVIATRGGEVVLDRSYGLADPATGRLNDANTIYDIGSVPFDFTLAAVYLLMQRGQLDLDDPITRFLPNVPEDKHAITIRHLLRGESGIANFHGRPEDEDFDLSWIDREEAERRILEPPLLFEPGTDRSGSHSAFGLLSAIVERIVDKTYEEFLHEELFAPAGLERTGFYGEDLGWSPEEFAAGNGNVASEPNVPSLWPRASWLVIGSGGMFSTPAELRRFYEYHAHGEGLSGRAQELYRDRGFVLGGSDRGFMAGHIWDEDGNHVYYATNAAGRNPRVRALEGAFVELVRPGGGLR